MATILTLEKEIRKYNKKADFKLIRKAYEFAKKAHANQKRLSGQPFIQHPLNTAIILAKLKLDTETIIAGLLHDTVEDTQTAFHDIKKEFGEHIAKLVAGVTKVKNIEVKTKEEFEAQTIRRMLFASAKDLRVMLIKLADKLDNLRAIHYQPIEKQWETAQEVLEIYAPLAFKLGLAKIKFELEDLAFEVLEPQAYKAIQAELKKKQSEREKETRNYINILRRHIKKNGIEAKVTGRPKHIYSIYKKLQRKESLENIYDIIGLRVITKTVKDCYSIEPIITQLWKVIREKDYIAIPKSTGYKSIHLTVITPNEDIIEVQIRTEEMNEIAENGIAAHWRYKGIAEDKIFDDKLNWFKENVLELEGASPDTKEFIDTFKRDLELLEDEIYTFTPKGKVIPLPQHSTVIDFAYAVHSDLGNHCTAAKVNGRFVPIRTELQDGDIVLIITSNNQHPTHEWLKYIRTGKARTKIKQYLRSIGETPQKSYIKEKDVKKEFEEWIINIEGKVKPDIKLAKCCNPIPGERIVGYTIGPNKVIIHHEDCSKAKKPGGHKVNVSWLENISSTIRINVEAKNRTGVFAEILNIILTFKVKISKPTAVLLRKKGIVRCSVNIETPNILQLKEIISKIKKIKDVQKVYMSKAE